MGLAARLRLATRDCHVAATYGGALLGRSLRGAGDNSRPRVTFFDTCAGSGATTSTGGLDAGRGSAQAGPYDAELHACVRAAKRGIGKRGTDGMAAPTLASPELATCPVADEILVERIRAGDQGAFSEIYERYFARIYHFVARRLRNRADTEETVQEVFVNVFASIDSFRGEAPFGAWVFGLTRRTVAGRFKKRMPNLVPLGDDEVESGFHGIAREPDPLEAYEYSERLARLEGAVSADLSEEQRQLFELHHIEHRSIQEIAHLLSKSEDAVKSHLYRARKVLLAS